MSDNDRYFKNYDYSQLALTADRRGFVVGQSRLGIAKLHTVEGDIEDIKGGFTSITSTCSVSVVDGSWVAPDVSSMTIVTRDETVFRVSDGDELALTYGGRVVFKGYVSESALASEIDENNTEAFTVTLTARGYEQLKNGLPAAGTRSVLYTNSTAPSEDGPVVAWPAGTILSRLQDVTGRDVNYVGDDVLAELLTRIEVEPDTSGTQGEIIADLSQRIGVVPDMSDGRTLMLYSYLTAAYWAFEDRHVVTGYTVAVDRQALSAVSVVRKEDTTFVRNYRAGTSRTQAEVSVSLKSSNEWEISEVPARVPLISKPGQYLEGLRIPRSDDFPLVTNMPIQMSYRRAGLGTIRGTALSMSHTIDKERWMIDIGGGPVELVTRVSQLNPTPPKHVRISLNGQTATLNWAGPNLTTITETAVGASQFVMPATAVPDTALGELYRVYDHTGTEKEDTLFRVTAITAPLLGKVQVTVSPPPAVPFVSGDVVARADYGVTPFGWLVLAQPQTAVDALFPVDLFSEGLPVQQFTTYTNSIVIPNLSNGNDYCFTVYALGSDPNIRSSASNTVRVTVGTPVSLNVTVGTVDAASVTLAWTWSGATLTGFKVGRDGIDANGFGTFETTLDPATLTVTFDKLNPGTVYHVYVAAMSGTTEVERVTKTITTTGASGGGPADPGFPSGALPLVGFSGLPFNSLVFLPNTTAAGAVAFGNDRRRPMDGLLFFPARGSWSDLQFVQPDHAAWVQSGHILVTTIPIAPTSEGNNMLANGANNAYATQQRAFGALIASRGMNSNRHVIRLNWECNGDWYNWAIKNGGVGAFQAAYRNCVTNIRAGGATQVLFNLCFNKGPSQSGADFAAFPGASYCDIIGVDAYDWFNTVSTDAGWATEIARTPGLQTVRDFATSNGIQWSLDEGGNVHQSPGGGDNVFYWQKMREFFYNADNVRNCAWHNTYNDGGAPDTLLHDFADNPNAYAYYKLTANWGGF